jgi:hypothetical protein
VIDRAVHRVAIVGRTRVLGVLLVLLRRAGPAEAHWAVHRLVVDERVVAAVHRDQQLPLLLRAPLAQDARDRVARRAEISRRLVGRVGVLNRAALFLELDRAQLLGCEPLVIGEVLDDVARVGGIEARVIQRHHALDGALPVLGCRAAERDPRHTAFVVGAMTGSAA